MPAWPAREGLVAVGVVLGDGVVVEIRRQAEHLLAGRGEILLERHRRVRTEVGALASEPLIERRDVDHAAGGVIEQALLRGPGVPVGLVDRRDVRGLELLAYREEFAPGRRDGRHADLVEEIHVVDDALGGHRVGQHARLAVVGGVLGDESLDVRVDGLGLRQAGQVGQHAPGDEDGRGQVVVVAVDGGRIAAHEFRDEVRGEVVAHHHVRLARVELRDQVVEVRDDLGLGLLEHDAGARAYAEEHPAIKPGAARAAAPSPSAFIAVRRPSTGPAVGVTGRIPVRCWNIFMSSTIRDCFHRYGSRRASAANP